MTSPLLDQIVSAVLYEGYILYPYRPSSKKARRERFAFGRVYPKPYSESQKGAEPCLSQTECLLKSSGGAAAVEVTVRFLQPIWRQVGYQKGEDEAGFQVVQELSVNGVVYQTWQEATERCLTVKLGPFAASGVNRVSARISIPAESSTRQIPGEARARPAIIRRRQESLAGMVEVDAAAVGPDIFKITVRVLNNTPMSAAQCNDQDAVILRTFASTHAILHAAGGEFVSMMDPPGDLKPLTLQCKNIGPWPVLVGDEARGERDTMLSSPIVLYDYPQISEQSTGSFFDGTEIDEMLTSRVKTMTDSEKRERRRVDECAWRILERTGSSGGQDLMTPNGTMRAVKPEAEMVNRVKALRKVFRGGKELKTGTPVRIHLKKRANDIDRMLDGKTAFIEAIEENAEGEIHLALVVEDDPDRNLAGARQRGHRFFYGIDEVEPLLEASA